MGCGGKRIRSRSVWETNGDGGMPRGVLTGTIKHRDGHGGALTRIKKAHENAMDLGSPRGIMTGTKVTRHLIDTAKD